MLDNTFSNNFCCNLLCKQFMLMRFKVTSIKHSGICDLKIKIAASLTLINIIKQKINNLLHAVNKHKIKANKF